MIVEVECTLEGRGIIRGGSVGGYGGWAKGERVEMGFPPEIRYKGQ